MGVQASAAVMTLFANFVYLIWSVALALVLIPFAPGEQASASEQFLLREWTEIPMDDLVLILITGATGAVGFWFSSQAYRIAQASSIAPYEYVMLIWVSGLSYFVWGEVPDGMTFLGSAIIVGAGLYVLQRERHPKIIN